VEILSMAGVYPSFAAALVVRGGHIVQMGPLAEAPGLTGPRARLVDLTGHTLLQASWMPTATGPTSPPWDSPTRAHSLWAL